MAIIAPGINERHFNWGNTAEQRAELTKLFTAEVTPEVATKRAILHVLSSPYFLYPAAGPQDDYAVAARLALDATGRFIGWEARSVLAIGPYSTHPCSARTSGTSR